MNLEQLERLTDSLLIVPDVLRRKIEKQIIDTFLKDLRLDLAMYHLMILRTLAERSGQTVNEVGQELAISKSQMTFATDRLVDLGLITRQSIDEDRRKVSLDLTLRGRWVLEELTKYLQKEFTRSLNDVSDEDLDQLESGLLILNRLAKRI